MRYFRLIDPDDVDTVGSLIPLVWNKLSDEFDELIPSWFIVNRGTLVNGKLDSVSVVYIKEVSKNCYDDSAIIYEEKLEDIDGIVFFDENGF